MAQTKSKTIKLGKVTYTRTVTPGNPGLKAAVITADKPKKEENTSKENKPNGFLPGPVGVGNKSRKIDRGGELIRLKRR